MYLCADCGFWELRDEARCRDSRDCESSEAIGEPLETRYILRASWGADSDCIAIAFGTNSAELCARSSPGTVQRCSWFCLVRFRSRNSKLAGKTLVSGSESVNSGEQLCLACGMCCDGSLFDNVRLGPQENATDLKARGLAVRQSRARVPVSFLPQPCQALCSDCTCRIYQQRPQQCRSFECGVFKDAQSGAISYEKAHRLVKQARRNADKVRALLRKTGERDERLSVGARFRRVQRWVEQGRIDAEAGESFAELGLAMHKFDLLAHRNFYREEDNASEG